LGFRILPYNRRLMSVCLCGGGTRWYDDVNVLICSGACTVAVLNFGSIVTPWAQGTVGIG
jgi:hypothetical protein